MDPQIEARLDAIERTVAENNKILRKMRSVQRNAQTMKLFYWLLIIISFIASWYFLKPYLSTLGGLYGVGSGQDTMDVNSLLESYKSLQE